MQYRSIGSPEKLLGAREALLRGIAPDGTLYVPQSMPALSAEMIQRLPSLEFHVICVEIARLFFPIQEIPLAGLEKIICESINFDAPVLTLDDRVSVLELFHGPTLAFKDFGARFMARVLSYFVREDSTELTVLVATSGDTGSAVAQGFFKVPGVRVVILYPKGKISKMQEAQLATLGGNIQALEIAGNFDDCQRLVKSAFLDTEISKCRRLTSANSINIARLIPQIFYYFRAVAQLKTSRAPLIISVPSGNFGNLIAGLMAKALGLPLWKFVAATNLNDVFVSYLRSGEFRPRASLPTLSNSMDVGDPSNLARIRHMYGDNAEKLREDVSAFSFSDAQTRAAIADVFDRYCYILDPHGAVAYLGLKTMLELHPHARGIFFETAHPAKFPDALSKEAARALQVPQRLSEALGKKICSTPLSSKFEDLKGYLLHSKL